MYTRHFNMGTRTIDFSAALLITTFLSLTCCNDNSQISKNFTVKNLSKANITRVGDDVLLLCEINDPYPIEIRKYQGKISLNASHGSEKSLTYLITSVKCENMGAYDCVANYTKTQPKEVLVDGCGPQPCQGELVNRTIFVKVGQRVELFFCVMAYPNILDFIKINNTNVRRGKFSNWTWDFKESRTPSSSIGHFNNSVSHDQMGEEEYGLLNIRIFNIAGEQYLLKYNFRLLASGPPECPDEVNVTDHGPHYVTLYWKPGLDGGADQSFHVYLSKDNVTWYRRVVNEKSTTVNMTELEEDTNYYFRVVSSNQYTKVVNETICGNTISSNTTSQQRTPSTAAAAAATATAAAAATATAAAAATATAAAAATAAADSFNYLPIIIGVSAFLVVLIFVLILGLWILKVKKRRLIRHKTAGNSQVVQSSQTTEVNGHQTEPGEYISQEGLKYITLDHARDTSQKRKIRNQKERKNDKIIYAPIDFTKTV